MEIKDLKNKKITVMGLGLNDGGLGVSEFLAKAGAKVLVTDLKSAKELQTSLKKLKNLPIKYILGEHREEDFINTEMIIKNPAVPASSRYLKIAQKHKVPIETDIGLFLKLLPKNQEIVAIAGTKGKTTTTNLIYQILKSGKKKVVLAGNMCISVFKVFPKITKNTIIVLEISEQQLEGLKDNLSPYLSVVTNILDDHLDRYGDLASCAKIVKRVFNRQKKNSFTIFNYDNLYTYKMAKEANNKVYWFSNKKLLPKKLKGTFLKNQKIFFQENEKQQEIMNIDKISLLGNHNITNILAAINAGIIYKIPLETIIKTIENFKGVSFRLEFIKEWQGIKFYNDTTATTPIASLLGLASFSKPLILITGGRNKKMDFKKFAQFIANTTDIKKIILLIHPAYDASQEIKKLVEKENKENKIIFVNSLKEATNNAIIEAKKQKAKIIILSPAATSFGMFQNEFDRGRQFNKIIRSL